MARKKSRWKSDVRGERHGALSRATGTPRGSKIPSRLVRKAKRGGYGKANQRRASAARGSSR